MIFLTLEDETGVPNVVLWKRAFHQYRRLLRVTGPLQREGIVVYLIAEQIEDRSHQLPELGHPLDQTLGTRHASADDLPRLDHVAPGVQHPHEQARKLFPRRDFH